VAGLLRLDPDRTDEAGVVGAAMGFSGAVDGDFLGNDRVQHDALLETYCHVPMSSFSRSGLTFQPPRTRARHIDLR
jgi:hypothetical protein